MIQDPCIIIASPWSIPHDEACNRCCVKDGYQESYKVPDGEFRWCCCDLPKPKPRRNRCKFVSALCGRAKELPIERTCPENAKLIGRTEFL